MFFGGADDQATPITWAIAAALIVAALLVIYYVWVFIQDSTESYDKRRPASMEVTPTHLQAQVMGANMQY